MYIPEFYFFTVFLKNRKISSKIKRLKVTDYAALNNHWFLYKVCVSISLHGDGTQVFFSSFCRDVDNIHVPHD